jgi:hypothetical protein
MLRDIARVFSSQGVLIPGAEAVPVSDRKGSAGSACDHKSAACGCFGPRFEQAAARLELSARGRELSAGAVRAGAEPPAGEGEDRAPGAGPGKTGADGGAARKGADGEPLGEEDLKRVRELEKRDREVKAHEAAHQAAAGGQARGGAGYEYETGPDGKRYAVGGHVDIDVSPVQGNPRATLEKAMNAQRAALAPADPSGQDRAVAAAAAQMAMRAQGEMARGEGGGEDAGRSGDEAYAAGPVPRGSRADRAYRPARAAGVSLSVYA